MSNEILMRFINNTCSDEELVLVLEWINESDENAKELFELEQVASHASCLSNDTSAMNRVTDKIKQRIFEAEFKRKKHSRKIFYSWASIAATIAVIIVTSLVLFKTPDVKMLSVVALNENQSVELPDGSVVYLNVGSELKYPENFVEDRRVSLSGEGFFKVTRDSAHPFRVEGYYLNVKVLGTEFNFCSIESGENSVSLLKGSVEICANDNKKEGVVLIPGQKADFDPTSGKLSVVKTNAEVDAAWHNKIIPFNNASIKEIAEILEQLYKVNISVDINIDQTKTYSGVTVYNDQIDSTLSQLSNTLPIDYSISGTSVIFKSKPVRNE